MAAALDGVEVAALSDAQLTDAMAAWRRMTSWAQANELAMVAELVRRREESHVHAPAVKLAEFIADEIALALTLSGGAAGMWAGLACKLVERLPRTRRALAEGLIDLARARVIADGLLDVDTRTAALVEQAILDEAQMITAGRLRHRLREVIKAVDPQAAEQRRERARKVRSLEKWATVAGTCELTFREMSEDDAEVVYNRINAVAQAMKADGDIRPIDAIRHDLGVALLRGTPLPDAARDLRDSEDGQSQSDRRGQDDETPDPGCPDQHDRTNQPDPGRSHQHDRTNQPDPGRSHQHDRTNPPEPGHSHQRYRTNQPDPGRSHQCDQTDQPRPGHSHQRDRTNLPEPGHSHQRDQTNPPEPGHSPRGDRPDEEYGNAVADAAAKITGLLAEAIDERLGSVADRHRRAGRHTGLALRIAAALQAMTNTLAHAKIHWCQTITGHGSTDVTAGRHHTDVTAGTHHDHHDQCRSEQHGHRGYRPPAAMRRMIERTYQVCAFPTCDRPARHCDLDHTIAWQQGGSTCPCNLSPLCRRHHRLKQHPQWHLFQPWPRLLVWVTPAGKWHTVIPEDRQ